MVFLLFISSLLSNCDVAFKKATIIIEYTTMSTEELILTADKYIELTNEDKGYLPGLDPDTHVLNFMDFDIKTFDYFWRNICCLDKMEGELIWHQHYKTYYLFKELKNRFTILNYIWYEEKRKKRRWGRK